MRRIWIKFIICISVISSYNFYCIHCIIIKTQSKSGFIYFGKSFLESFFISTMPETTREWKDYILKNVRKFHRDIGPLLSDYYSLPFNRADFLWQWIYDKLFSDICLASILNFLNICSDCAFTNVKQEHDVETCYDKYFSMLKREKVDIYSWN